MVFSTNGARTLDICMQKNDGRLLSHNTCKNELRWITDFNVRAKAIKHVEESLRVNLCDFQLGRIFLDRTHKAKGAKGRKKQINWILPKLKIFILQRMLSRRKIQSTDYDKVSANTTYKEPLQLNKNSIFKWTKNVNRPFSKKDIQMTIQHMKSTIRQ